MGKVFNLIYIIFISISSLIFLNLVISCSESVTTFPFIFTIIGCFNVYVGIKFLNERKIVLSIFTFSLSALLFITVCINLFLENNNTFF